MGKPPSGVYNLNIPCRAKQPKRLELRKLTFIISPVLRAPAGRNRAKMSAAAGLQNILNFRDVGETVNKFTSKR